MEIRINSVSLCQISDSFLSDVYDVLTRYAMQFHIDQDHQKLYIVSPVQGIRIYLEMQNGFMPQSMSAKLCASLTQLGFDVCIMKDEEEKRRQQRLWDASKPSLWVSMGNNKQYVSGMSIYFSMNKKKASKQLATLLSQNISRMTDISVNGTFFEWKNTMNSLIPLAGSEPAMPKIQLAWNDYFQMNERQIEDFTYCMTRTFASYYHQSFLIDVIQYFLYFQHAPIQMESQEIVSTTNEEILQVPVGYEEQMMEQQEVKDNEQEQEQESEQGSNLQQEEQEIVEQMGVYQEEQLEEKPTVQGEEIVQQQNNPSEVTNEQDSMNYSTFSWIQSQIMKQGTKKRTSREMTTASFMGQMNRLTHARQPQKEKQEVNILAFNNRKKR